MAETKWTPGPWELRVEGVSYGTGHTGMREFVAKGDKEIASTRHYAERFNPNCRINGREVTRSDVEGAYGFRAVYGPSEDFPHSADAHLIAAAPALYEALDGLRQEIEYIAAQRSYAVGLGASEWGSFLTAKERVAWEASVTALAQARGESTKEVRNA